MARICDADYHFASNDGKKIVIGGGQNLNSTHFTRCRGRTVGQGNKMHQRLNEGFGVMHPSIEGNT